jgi:predicted regulator of Ras-like GTPase activity (Roadblock/LC7/MglB family)
MLKEKITGFIDEIRSIEGVTACALVSRDGIMVGTTFRQGTERTLVRSDERHAPLHRQNLRQILSR